MKWTVFWPFHICFTGDPNCPLTVGSNIRLTYIKYSISNSEESDANRHELVSVKREDGGKRPPPSLAAPRFEGAKAAPKNGVSRHKKQGRAQIWSRWNHGSSRGGCLFVFVVEKHIYIFRGHEKNHPFWRESNNCKIYDDFEGFPVFSSAGNITTPCIYSFKGTRPTSNFSLSQKSFDEKNRCTRCSVWSLQGWEEKEKEEEKTLGAQLLMEELEWIVCIL